MTVFWIFALGLIALALALVLPSLFSQRVNPPGNAAGIQSANLAILRDQLAQLDVELAAGSLDGVQHAQARAEIERRALEEESTPEGAAVARPPVRTAVVVALGVPLIAFGMYGFLGNSQALLPAIQVATPGSDVTLAQVESMVAQLAQRLENPSADRPADPEAWEMLARSYAALQRYPEASKAYARASELAPTNAQLLADHADVLAMLQGQSAAGEPTRLIERALKLDPNNLKALALAGSAAFERKDFAAATTYWTKARAGAPAGSEFASALDRSLAEIGASKVAIVEPISPNAAAGAGVAGSVRVAPALADKIRPDDTVYIFARAAEGPRMPVAILRRKASELPINFTLDDSTAMSAELRLSGFSQVVVGARISRSGNATPQSGDLIGQSGPVKPGTANLMVTIGDVQP